MHQPCVPPSGKIEEHSSKPFSLVHSPPSLCSVCRVLLGPNAGLPRGHDLPARKALQGLTGLSVLGGVPQHAGPLPDTRPGQPHQDLCLHQRAVHRPQTALGQEEAECCEGGAFRWGEEGGDGRGGTDGGATVYLGAAGREERGGGREEDEEGFPETGQQHEEWTESMTSL